MTTRVFGFSIRNLEEEAQLKRSPVSPSADDSAIEIGSPVGGMLQANRQISVDNVYRSENALINKYRDAASSPFIDTACEAISSEAVVTDDITRNAVQIKFIEDTGIPDNLQEQITEEFNHILKLFNFKLSGNDIFRRWYVDGRIYFHKVIDEKNPGTGIQELRYIDPRKIKKVRIYGQNKDAPPDEFASMNTNFVEFWVFCDTGIDSGSQSYMTQMPAGQNIIQIAKDSIAHVTSGLWDPSGKMVISHLHKILRTFNQFRMLEDSVVIYRLIRAPERRKFLIDVGNLPKAKAEASMRDLMQKFKNKLTYNACLAMGTKIPLLDGRTLTLTELSEEYMAGKTNWVYSCDPNTGEFAPGIISYAGLTRRDAEVLKITLDNGKEIVCTPDHKFPVWEKGKVEAKDLVVGESMLPLYRREQQIYPNIGEQYEQIFENESKKWKFVHRLVSAWKDSVGIENEYEFDANYVGKEKNTVHHKNFVPKNNTPENLVRMNKIDHLLYHKHIGKINGSKHWEKGQKKQKENKTGFYGMTLEQRQYWGKIAGHKGGLKSVEMKTGIHGQTPEQKLAAAVKGSERFQFLLTTDEEFRRDWSEKQKAGWTPEKRELRGKQTAQRHTDPTFKEMQRQAVINYNNSVKEWYAALSSEKQEIFYTDEMFGILKNTSSTKIEDVVKEFNTYLPEYSASWVEANNGQWVREGKFTHFTQKDLRNMVNRLGYPTWRKYKKSQEISYRNHKIVKIEWLEDKIDTGTLTIDRDEKYHSYHTFALDAGIYTCNSSGEINEDKRFIAMTEDYWFAVRGGQQGTDVEQFPGGSDTGQVDDVRLFKETLYRGLNIPISRIDPSAAQVDFSANGTQITRDELTFARFINRLRVRFCQLFDDVLSSQLILKGILTKEEWEEIKDQIIWDWARDSYYAELKDLEILQQKMGVAAQATQFLQLQILSREFIWREIFKFDDKKIKEISAQSQDDAMVMAEVQAQQQEIMGPPPGEQPEAPPTSMSVPVAESLSFENLNSIQDEQMRNAMLKLFESVTRKHQQRA